MLHLLKTRKQIEAERLKISYAPMGAKKIYRDYQIKAAELFISAVEENAEKGVKNWHIIVMPTGTGKTATAKHCLETLAQKKGEKLKVCWIAHTQTLLIQAEAELSNSEGLDVTYTSSFEAKPLPVADVYILDEAHHQTMNSVWKKLHQALEKIVLGLTAELKRGDNAILMADNIHYPITRMEAINQGYMMNSEVHSFLTLAQNDYHKEIMPFLEDNPSYMQRSIVFCESRTACKELETFMRQCNINAIDVSDLNESQLKQALDNFSTNQVDSLICVNRIGEGVDVQGVVHVIMLKNYSSNNYQQMNQNIGRGVRIDQKINPHTNENATHSFVLQVINPTMNNLAAADFLRESSPDLNCYLYDWNEDSKQWTLFD